MLKRRTYVDSCVLLNAFQGKDEVFESAIAVLDDPEREFVVSDFLKLETIPKPTFLKKEVEVEFMTFFFDKAAETVEASPSLTEQALNFASRYDLSPCDALHISAAVMAKVDEFISSEKPSKPMFKVSELRMTSLHSHKSNSDS